MLDELAGKTMEYSRTDIPLRIPAMLKLDLPTRTVLRATGSDPVATNLAVCKYSRTYLNEKVVPS